MAQVAVADAGFGEEALTQTAARKAAGARLPDMVWIEGGSFLMGSDRHYREEAPQRTVVVDGFWIDRTPVTNREFARFVAETGYSTLAERPTDPAAYPGATPEMLAPASSVYFSPERPVDLRDPYNW